MSSSKSYNQILQELNLLETKYDEVKKELERERSLNSSLQEKSSIVRIYKTLFDSATIGIFLSQQDKVIYANPFQCHLFGYEKENEILGKEVAVFASENLREEQLPQKMKGKTGNVESISFGIMGNRKDGTSFPIQVDVTLIDLSDGPAILYFVKDLTVRKEVEEKLQERQNQIEDLLANLDLIILEGDPFDINRIYGRIEDILGYSKEEWINHPKGIGGMWSDLIHPDYNHIGDLCMNEIGNCRDHSFEYKLRHKNGSYRWFFDTITVESENGKPIKTRSVSIDITDVKITHEKLSESEERYRTLFESSPLGIAIIRQKEILFANESFIKMHGYDHKVEFENQPISNFQAPELVEELAQRGLSREQGGIEPISYDSIGLKKDGTRFPIHINVDQINLVDGPAIISFISDITEQKVAEHALKESEDRFRRLNEATYDGIAIHVGGRIEEVNESFVQMFEYDTTEEVIGMTSADFTTSESLALTYEKIEQKSEEPYEIIAIKKDGTQIDCLVVSKNCYYKEQEARITAFKDISLEKQADREIRNLLARFETLYNEAPISIVIIRGTKYLFANPAYCRLTGYEENELAGKDINITQTPEQSQDIRNRIERRVDGVTEAISYQGIVIRKDGERRIIFAEVTNINLADGPATLVFVRDMTEQKHAQIALEKSEKNFRNLVETSQDLIWKCDADGRFTYLNPSWEDTHGYPIDEMLGKAFTDFQTPEIAERDIQEFGRHLAGGGVKGYQTTQITKSGNEIELVFNAIPLFDEEGNIIGTQGTAYDITSLIQKEKEIQDSLTRYQILYEATPVGIIITRGTKFIFANPAYCKIVGYSEEELVGEDISQFQPSNQAKFMEKRIERRTKGLDEPTIYESTVFRKDGVLLNTYVSVASINLPDGKATLVFIQDITKLKQKEAKLKENEEKYRSLVETSQNLIWQCDTEGRFTYLNPAWEDLLEYSLHEMLGRKFTDFKDPAEAETTYQVFLKTLREEISLTGFESSYISKSGQTKILIFNAIPLKSSTGEVTGTQGTAYDITDRIKTEIALRESEERYRTLIEKAPEAIIILDIDKMQFIAANEATIQLFKTSEDELLNSPFDRFSPEYQPDGRPSMQIVSELVEKVYSGESLIFEWQHKNGEGKEFPCEIRLINFPSSEERLVRGSILDITKRKQAQIELKKSEQRYKGIIETQSEFIVRWLPDGVRTFVNDAYCKYFNITKEEAIGTSFFPLIVEEYSEKVKQRLDKLSVENPVSTDEHEVILSNGSTGWNLWTDQAIFDKDGNVIEYQSVGIDITEMIKSKAALQTMEGRYRTLFESSPLGIVVIRDITILFANSSFSTMYGYTHENEIIGKPISQLQSADLIEMLEIRGLNRQHGGEEPTSYDSFGKRKNGTEFPIHVEVTSIDLPDGPAVMSFVQDITDKKQAELDLIQTQEKLQTVISNAPVVLWALDSNGVFTLSEGNALNKLGLKPGQIVGQSVYTVYKDNPDIIEAHKNALNGIPGTVILVVGNSFFESHLKPQFDSEGNVVGMIGIAFDITNIKLAEDEIQATRDQLYQAQKMEAIGRIAGGIAHDFNNLLTLITLNSEILVSKIPRTDPAFTNLQNIIDSVKNATALTSELLLFSRNRMMTLKRIHVNDVINKFLKTFGQFIRSNIKQKLKLDPFVGDIEIDPTRLDQVLMNLVLNAVDAMPEGGTLTIETKYIQKNTIKHHGKLKSEPLVEISILDTGIGMDQGTQKRIFEPFFTTKEEGKGTGLGLATAYSIVQQSEGFIEINSEINQGSKFMIYIPVIDIEKDIEVEQVLVPPEVIGNEQFVLLVDDDVSIREIIKNILEMSGFVVLGAGNAFEALRIYKENIERITLIITDIMMPNVTGTELMDQIREINSSAKVLFITGYTKNFQSIADQTDSKTGFLQKPFDQKSLFNKLSELIDE